MRNFLFLCLVIIGLPQAAVKSVSNPAYLLSAVSTLKAGDTVLLNAGTYNLTTLAISGKSGTPDSWILIKGVGRAVLNGTSTGANVVELTNVSYIRLCNLEITASVADGPDGIKINGKYNAHVELDSLYIHHVPFGGIEVFPDSMAFLSITNCEIAHTLASGIYIGYPNRNTVHDVLIDHNYMHHCPEDPLSDIYYGIQFKGWCYRARITNNVLHDISGTSRSAICVYYGKKGLAGDVPADMNVVSGNVIWNSRNEGITAMSDALVENNIIFDAVMGLHLQTYSDGTFAGSNYVENLVVRNNTVFRCTNECLNVEGWTTANLGVNVQVARNVFYQDNSSKTAIYQGVSINPPAALNYYYGANRFSSGVAGFVNGNGLEDFYNAASDGQVLGLNFYPSDNAPFMNPPDSLAWSASDDFEGTTRPAGAAAEAGAYESRGCPLQTWVIQPAFKGTTFSYPAVEKNRAVSVGGLSLGSAPNPFADKTIIRVPDLKEPANYRVFSLSGKLVYSLSVNTHTREIQWAGRDNAGRKLPAGCYIGEFIPTAGQRLSQLLLMTR